MVNTLGAINSSPLQSAAVHRPASVIPKQKQAVSSADTLSLGAGPALNKEKAGQIVLERAYNQLRGIVNEARAALGLSPDQFLDISEEATAGRIVDFALNFFERFAKNNGLANDEAGRGQYASFIGKAIEKGIGEAEGILSALNVSRESSGFDIGKTRSIIQDRLDNFVANGR